MGEAMTWKPSSLKKLRTVRRAMLRRMWGERWKGEEVVEVDSDGEDNEWVEEDKASREGGPHGVGLASGGASTSMGELKPTSALAL